VSEQKPKKAAPDRGARREKELRRLAIVQLGVLFCCCALGILLLSDTAALAVSAIAAALLALFWLTGFDRRRSGVAQASPELLDEDAQTGPEVLDEDAQMHILKRQAEVIALQSQINPHFLYNTLNSVCSLIKTGQNDAAYRMIHSIGTFYRTALSSGKVMINIREEMANAQSYIDIQSMRYGEKIRYEIEVGEVLMARSIVKFTLQPLIENAIYHGVKPLDSPGVIRITGAVSDGEVRLSVSDNGVGMEPEKVAALLDAGAEITKTSFGLNNIDRRLKLYFGQAYGLRIESAPGAGTTVTVVLPDREEGL